MECDLLVLGSSFTGIELMHQLERMGTLTTMDTIVVDAQAEHAYIPLIHEFAVSTRSPDDYVLSTARYVSSLPRTRYLHDTVISVDAEGRVARLSSGRLLKARAIVFALGSSVEAPEALSMVSRAASAKFLSQGLELRRRLQALSGGRIVVVGGGITGVEMAGELAMWARKREGDFSISVVHSAPHLLGRSRSRVGCLALRLLEGLGVNVHFNARVEALKEDLLVCSKSSSTREDSAQWIIGCAMAIWAGGIRPPSVSRALGVRLNADGWLQVDPWLRCTTEVREVIPGVFAGGDAVRIVDDSGIWPTMQRAIECIWQGKTLARSVSAHLHAPESAASSCSLGLKRHRLVRDFPYGISIGPHSLVMYGSWVVNLRAWGVAFRRWLMRRYFSRYASTTSPKSREREGDQQS